MDQDEQKVADLLENQDMVDRKFADRVAAWFDSIGTTPNRLTMWRIVLSLPMCLCFTLALSYTHRPLIWFFYHVCGVLLYIWCALLDFFDGSLARYQTRTYGILERSEDEERALSFWQKLNLRGSSKFGAVLDPFSDKTLYFGTIFPLGWTTLNHSILFGSLAIAILLTAIRFRAIRKALNLVGKGAANRIGKYKIWIEVVAAASLGLLPTSTFKIYTANISVSIALFIGILSLAGHTWLGYKRAAMLRKTARDNVHTLR